MKNDTPFSADPIRKILKSSYSLFWMLTKLCLSPQIVFFGLLVFAGVLLGSCSPHSGNSFVDCPEAKPQAVFDLPDKTIINVHQFNIEGFQSLEQVLFSNDVHLELMQTGCKPMIQVYTIQFPANHSFSEYQNDVAAFTAATFGWLGSLSPDLLSLKAWSEVFSSLEGELRSGEVFDVEDHYEAKADLVISETQLLLMVELKML